MVPVGSDMIPEIEHIVVVMLKPFQTTAADPSRRFQCPVFRSGHDPTAFSAHATTVDCLAPAPLAGPRGPPACLGMVECRT
jgi:hypothetical protein